MTLTSHIRTLLFNCFWLVVLSVSTPWLLWRMLTKGKNRRGWKQKLFGLVPVADRIVNKQRIWLHAVSLGEVHVLKTLVDQIQREQVDCELFISTTTETGFDRATSLFAEQHTVFFFPFDFSWAIQNVFNRIRPDLLVLAELELWPNLIHLARQSALPVMVANGRLSENSHANYRKFAWLTRSMFEKLSLIAVQDQEYADRFVDLGCAPEIVKVTGNLKYDSIETNRANHKSKRCREVASQFGMAESSPVFVAGSTQVEDESAAIDAWLKSRDQIQGLRLIIVPRHPERASETLSLLKERGLQGYRRSAIPDSDTDRREKNEASVLVVDVIGELAGWWAIADVAFVGGSMGSRGGQNMIEPAAYGIPVCFGPNTVNFKSTVDGLLACEGAKVVSTSDELSVFISEMLSSEPTGHSMGNRAQEFVLSHKGAVSQTVRLIRRVLAGDENGTQLERAA